MQKITPFLWFDKNVREAAEFYVSVFGDDSEIVHVAGLSGTPSGDIEVVTLKLRGHEFTLMGAGPEFKFTEAVSFLIECDDQAEVDYFWEKLSASPANEQCGWLKDKYGLSWQVTPKQMMDYLNGPDSEGRNRALKAMMGMRKLVIDELRKAYAGEI